MSDVMKNLREKIKSAWRKVADRHFFDHHLAKRYYEKKHAWYEKTYWEGYSDNDLYRPNGIMGDNKEHLLTKAAIVVENTNHDGNIIDLGCGNGLLLKIITEKSPHRLIPYGIDFLGKSILQAHSLFPEMREHFLEKNIVDYIPKVRFYSIILSPGYIRAKDFSSFLSRWIDHLEEGGKIFLFSTPDNLEKLVERLHMIESSAWNSTPPKSKNGITWIVLERGK